MSVIESSLLWDEVMKIKNSGAQPVNYFWSCTIHCGDIDVVPQRLLSVELDRYYGKRVGDIIVIEVAVGAGDYNMTMFKNKANLTVTLQRTPTSTMDNAVLPPDDIEVQTFRGVLVNDTSEVLTPAREFNDDINAMNAAGIVKVELQLLDLAMEQLMSKSISLGVRSGTAGGMTRYILTKLSREIDVKAEYAIQGVQMATIDNSEPRAIQLKTDTMFLDAPTLLHEQHGGIYSAGFAFYLQRGWWYCWPRWDVTKFGGGRPTLTIIGIPDQKLPSIERTYRLVGESLIVLLTGGLKYMDGSTSLKYDKGNGTRFVDSRSIMTDAIDVEGNKLVLDRSLTTTEYVGEKRDTGLENVRTGASRITSNSFVEAGLVTERQGSYIQGIWQNSEYGYLYPGMPVKYLYLLDGEVQEAFGVLDSAQTYIEPIEEGLTFTRHRTNTALTAFLGARLDWSKENEG